MEKPTTKSLSNSLAATNGLNLFSFQKLPSCESFYGLHKLLLFSREKLSSSSFLLAALGRFIIIATLKICHSAPRGERHGSLQLVHCLLNLLFGIDKSPKSSAAEPASEILTRRSTKQSSVSQSRSLKNSDGLQKAHKVPAIVGD